VGAGDKDRVRVGTQSSSLPEYPESSVSPSPADRFEHAPPPPRRFCDDRGVSSGGVFSRIILVCDNGGPRTEGTRVSSPSSSGDESSARNRIRWKARRAEASVRVGLSLGTALAVKKSSSNLLGNGEVASQCQFAVNDKNQTTAIH
jgi:hypothetical protein